LAQTIRLVLNDDQWKRIEKLCVDKPEDPGGAGATNRMFKGMPWIRIIGRQFGNLRHR
jgi:hypothetical protein